NILEREEMKRAVAVGRVKPSRSRALIEGAKVPHAPQTEIVTLADLSQEENLLSAEEVVDGMYDIDGAGMDENDMDFSENGDTDGIIVGIPVAPAPMDVDSDDISMYINLDGSADHEEQQHIYSSHPAASVSISVDVEFSHGQRVDPAPLSTIVPSPPRSVSPPVDYLAASGFGITSSPMDSISRREYLDYVGIRPFTEKCDCIEMARAAARQEAFEVAEQQGLTLVESEMMGDRAAEEASNNVRCEVLKHRMERYHERR
ncbi:hypothetical protein HDU93_005984, partial [Gonapodya sp. JEL0774]